MTKKIAIIGGGIVGSSAAYFLSKNQADYEVTLFDNGEGQATKAAAGIISPWLSKRRNKQWYQLAKDGVSTIEQIAAETNMDSVTFSKVGTIISRKDPDKLQELFNLAQERKKDAPEMGSIKLISSQEIKELIPIIDNYQYNGILVTGGSRIDGNLFCNHLLEIACRTNLEIKKGQAILKNDNVIAWNNQEENFDKIIVAAGAWTKIVLQNVGSNLRLRPQKGQLIEIEVNQNSNLAEMPVMMPESEYDFIPAGHNKLIIGATHDNEKGFDLEIEKDVDRKLLKTASSLIDNLNMDNIILEKTGTRAYTDDFSPVFGNVPANNNVLFATGLGSSGLTTGPLIGKILVDMIDNKKIDLSKYEKSIDQYFIH
ncbi:FAD-dependent oxidoreductase [Fructilactobacillus vespulae]|uniref:NAD(P)/FAD-dependent oxidoreductase n=1 Tax=Fructilactobacillus vespulae TaxID=1249630 RepID=UPI0039B6094B